MAGPAEPPGPAGSDPVTYGPESYGAPASYDPAGHGGPATICATPTCTGRRTTRRIPTARPSPYGADDPYDPADPYGSADLYGPAEPGQRDRP